MNSPTIAIIGGGFCGTATLINLLKLTEIPLNVVLINKDYPEAKGIAFGTHNKKHVLNVPASKMSINPDDPDNFINWIKSKPEYFKYINDELNDRFLPRVIYGHYMEDQLAEAINNMPKYVNVKILKDEALDIIPVESGAELILKKNESLTADKIVLALGNFIPDNPKIKDNSFYNSKRYFQNPWKKESVEGLSNTGDVFIIGTGLTMVDSVISLLDSGFTGKIYAVSTNGYFPLSHKKRKPYTEILKELHAPYEISSLYRIFRKHIKYVLSHGITGEAVVDAVRPKTQEIWLSLSLNDKLKFMSHIRHLWGVARHRLPQEIFDEMQNLIHANRLQIIGGRLLNINESNNGVSITLKKRKTQEIAEYSAQRVINCTGPKTDLTKIDEHLVKNLLKRGLIVSDEMKLGINALPDGTVIQKDHSLSPVIFTIGSLLKGILWESTAVPELRVQAKSLAEELVRQLSVSSGINVKDN